MMPVYDKKFVCRTCRMLCDSPPFQLDFCSAECEQKHLEKVHYVQIKAINNVEKKLTTSIKLYYFLAGVLAGVFIEIGINFFGW